MNVSSLSTPARRSLGRILALALPVLAVAALIVRAELVLQTGRTWTVAISGYDPRDLLRGQYLRYRIDWQTQGAAQCSGSGCCYCLWDAGVPSANATTAAPQPAVSIIACADRAPCQSYFSEEQAEGLQKYFIPEGQGDILERALRQRQAALRIVVSPRGRVALSELVLDGEPWREAIRHPPRSPRP